MSDDFTFPRRRILRKRSRISELFADPGGRVSRYPILIFYRASDSEVQPLVLFSVSKKHFKRAVDRNRVKRLMREAVRLEIPCSGLNELTGLELACVYIGKDIRPLTELKKSIRKCFDDLKSHI